MNEPIDCAECQEQVHEYLQNEVDEDVAAAVTAHLANCDHCVELYDSEEALNQVIRDSCTRETPEDIISKIRAHIAGLD